MSVHPTIPMTPQGHQALIEELRHLKTTVRAQVLTDLAEARAHGDLSENAEYDAAKERQAFVEARIRDLEGKVARVQVVDTSKLSGDKIVFGATVTIVDTETDIEQTWMIVGEEEADLKARRISILSPMARALVGKSEGDTVELHTPKGLKEYEVLRVEFR